MTKLASISYALIGILIVQLVFITVVNILLCLINKLSDKSHIDTEKKNMASMMWDTRRFRHL